MNTWWAWCTLLAIISHWSATVAAGEVLELTGIDFDSTTQRGLWFVNHFSPFCPHCRQFAPTWQQLANEHETLENFHFAKVDCTLQADLCSAHKVRHFPTLQLFVDGNAPAEEYPTVDRNYEKLTAYIVQQAEAYNNPSNTIPAAGGSSSSSSSSSSDINSSKSSNNNVVANPDGVSIHLNGNSLEAAKQSGLPWFIKFYAPWCGHCQKLAPAWEQMAKDLKRQVNVGEVNCVDYRDACVANGVHGFPTLKLYMDGTEHDYHDDRSLVSLVGFATKIAGPTVLNLNWGQLENRLQQEPVAFVFLYADERDSVNGLMKQVAQQFVGDLGFYLTSDSQAVRQYNLAPADLPAALIVKDGKHVIYPSHQFTNTESVRKALTGWIQSEKFPLVSDINPGNAPEILQGTHTAVVGVINNNDIESIAKFHVMAETQSKQQKASKSDRVLFAMLEGTTWGTYARTAYSVHPNRLPALIIVDPLDHTYYAHNLDGQKFSLDDPDSVLQALKVDIPEKNLIGVSTLPFHARVGQSMQHGFGILRAHWLLTCGAFAALLYILVKRTGRRKGRSSVLPVKSGPRD
ncbi:thioredoxin-like protein [Zychaea mexicana]|uniref:thioredoxin-like protein n=1 Tax=Zychaea mexicana TaxID=64656 RepID=UPI0022FF2E02|nr:thioredoxin-like protein [Zychaea mexicana]KAI9474330.1 thioredoxin-like protein [Zychaea mexicana]